MSVKRARVAVVCDYPEEGWPSMDLTARMTLEHLEASHADEFDAVHVCPLFRQRFGRLPTRRAAGVRRNADRILNRHRDYPRFLRSLSRREPFDLYHIVDHSYAHLVHAVPPGRAVVTCHDLDTFRCLLRPDVEPRPRWFRALARRTLTGLQAAAALSCDSEATRAAILEHGLVPEDRLTINYLGTSPEFTPDADPCADATADGLIGPSRPGDVDLLHVGSNIPRKRIDVLIAAFAAVRREIPRARLVKVGGELTPEQGDLARGLGVLAAIRVIPLLTDRAALAAIYRRAALVLQPSDAEGFGLPLAEAMACGAPLLVSDLAVLREVAGDAAVYEPAGDVSAWSRSALALVRDASARPPDRLARRDAGLARARLFRWSGHADRLAAIYCQALGRLPVGAGGAGIAL